MKRTMTIALQFAALATGLGFDQPDRFGRCQGRWQPHRLLLGPGGMVPADGQRVPEGDRHHRRHDPQELGRDLRPGQGRGRQSARATSGGAAPAIRICRRPRKDLTEAYESPMLKELQRLGDRAAQDRGRQDRRHLSGRARLRLQRRRAEGEAASKRPKCWADLDQARIQGRGAGRQSELIGHRLHLPRHHGADPGRGRGLRIPEGAGRRTSTSTPSRAPPRRRRRRAARR